MDPTELFFGLCRYYSSLGLDEDITWSSWGQRTIAYFDQLGRMLGYKVYTEDTLTSTEDWECPPSLYLKRIDMTWVYPDRDIYALAMEHQGSNNPRTIRLDIKKLSIMDCFKVLVVYQQDTDKVQKWIQKEVSRGEGDFVLINIPSYFSDTTIEKLAARLVSDQGKLIGAGTAEARKESITGLRFFSNPRWLPRQK